MSFSRRQFLAATMAVGWSPWTWTPARAAAWERTLRRVAGPDGTTLAVSVVRGSGDGYVTLREGPGWPLVERTDLTPLRSGRDDRRRAIAAFVHLTDVHLIDAQSPGRVEFLDRFGEPFTAAFRPQETLTTQVQSSMVQRIRELRRGPVTGRRLDAAVSTGDNIDNCQHNELDWFIGVLDGGEVTANSGDPDRYEGVQLAQWADARYWHPDGGVDDEYRRRGFPEIPELLEAAIRAHESPGLDIPWFSTYGNHDGLIQGNLPRTDAFDELLVASFKVTDLPTGGNPASFIGAALGDAAALARQVADGSLPSQPITADEQRRTLTTADWVRAHLASDHRPSPPGHGYTEDHLDGRALSYRFEIAPGVVGISMDTGGYNSGSIGEAQLTWLETELAAVHSRSFDPGGTERRSGADDQLVLLFSHFTAETMRGAPPDPARPGERRIEGDELVAFLHRWPNLIAWVNGHTHSNAVRPMPDPSGRTGGFWQITTASHVDFPEQARIVELADNDDGTLSIFCTMIEHLAPVAADHSDLSPLGLASISRELSANNDPQAIARHVGQVDSLNVELALPAPFDLRRAGIGSAAASADRSARGDAAVSDGDELPLPVLVSAGAAALGATAVGALALRTRRMRGRVDQAPEDGGDDAGSAGDPAS